MAAVAPVITVPFKYHWLPVVAEDEIVLPVCVITGLGGIGFTTNSKVDENAETQPFTVDRTEYAPACVATSVGAIAPLRIELFMYHWFPEAAEDVSVADEPAQIEKTPPGLIVGVDGVGLTVT